MPQIKDGPYVDIDPVYTVELEKDAIKSGVMKVIEAGLVQLPIPTKEEWQAREDPVLRATGTESWKQMVRSAASYSILWLDDEVTLYFSKLDKKGRFETDADKTRVLPASVSLDEIVEAILEDVKMREKLR